MLSFVMLYQSPEIRVARRKTFFYMYTTRVMSSKSLQIFEALLLLRTILNRWCGSPAKAIEKKENRQTSRSFILSKVIKSVGLNFLPVVLTGDRKKKKQFFLVSRQVLSLKKTRKTKNWFNSPVCFHEIFDLLPPCILQVIHSNKSVGRYNFITFRIMSLVKSRRKND